MAEPVLYHWPEGRSLYCRTCERLTVHDTDPADNRYVLCALCRHPVFGAEVVSIYADDKYDRVPRVLLPLSLRAPSERAEIQARVLYWQPTLGVLGTYVPAEDAQWDGLDELLAELAG